MSVRCHYEVLGIEQDSTDEEIKKGYRKSALRWHPDKNVGDEQAAKKEFLLVKQAYQVLIDPQERAWYDGHREVIIGGGDKYQHNCLNLFLYFRASCYKGFGDDPQGFYKVYSNVFELLFEEEVDFLDQTPDMEIAPKFGNSKSPCDEIVKGFYGYWEGFCTAKSYVWVEKYNTREASYKSEKRYMEKENTKLINKAKKDRNEEIRALVAFVKKRDPRVQEYHRLMKEKALERMQLAEERRKEENKKKLEDMRNYKESEWSSFSTLNSELERLEKAVAAEFSDEDEDFEVEADDSQAGDDNDAEGQIDEEVQDLNDLDMLYCIACDKSFKSLSTIENHRKSKKHLTNAAGLVKQMKLQNAELLDDDVELLLNPTENVQTRSKKSKKNRKKNKPERATETPPSELDEISPAEEDDANTPNEEKVVEKPAKAQTKTQSNIFSCNVCNGTFPTRNKLFEHIKAEGHALKVEAKAPPKAGRKEKKLKN